MKQAKVLYDFADQLLNLFPAGLFISASLCCLIYVWRIYKIYPKSGILSFLFKHDDVVVILISGCFALLPAYLFLNIKGYSEAKSAYSNGQLKETTGYITGFKEGNYSKYNTIAFRLNALLFDFTDHEVYYGCTYEDLKHARLGDSSFLHIYYYNDEGANRALRIEALK